MGLPNNVPLVKTICLIQTTRFGDVLQTITVAAELKKEHPSAQLIFVGRKQFSEQLTFLISKIFDQYYYLDFLKIMDGGTPKDLNKVQNNLEVFLTKINSGHIDLAVNLSFSTSSSYLTALINADTKMGLSRNTNGELIIPDVWSQFVYSNVMGGANNPFSLIDIYKTIIGVTANSYVKQGYTNTDKRKIIVHPFASSNKKSWNHNKWIELIYQILKNNEGTEVTIVGSTNEQHEAKIYSQSPILKRFDSRIKNKVGLTNLQELYNEFSDTRMFIGHDSMVSHMAALKNIQSIILSMGTVRPHETTPYGQSNYNIVPKTSCFPCFPDEKCDLMSCHKDLSYQAINTLISGLLDNKQVDYTFIKNNCSPIHLQNMAIYKSSIDMDLGMQLHNISQNESDIKEVFKQIYSVIWSFLLKGLECGTDMPVISSKTTQQLLHYIEGIKNLYELNNFGSKYSNYILDETSSATPDIAKIKNHAKKIGEIDQLSSILKRTFPLLAPIVDLYNVAKGNLVGETIIDLAQSSLITYHDSNSAVSVMFELIENIVEKNNHQTKNISTNNSLTSASN